VPLKKSLPPQIGGAANPPAPFRAPDRPGLDPRSTAGEGPRVVRLLAIRADFTDQPMDSTEVYYNRLLLFLTQYFRDTSAGKVIFEPTLTDVYRMPETMAYYGVDDSLGSRESLFCYDAVRAADPDFNYADYDQVVVFHAGAGQESDVKNDSPEQIWSVFFRQIDFQYYLPRPGAELGIRTQDLTAAGDTIHVPSVGIYPETQSQDGYVFSCVGVVCHEMGHALGLPDLYDTTSPAGKVFAESQGNGSFELMASGTWNANGFVPAEFSAWSKVALGWIDPVVVAHDGTVRLSAVQRNRQTGVVKIPLSGDEYFLVENRSQDPNGDQRFNFDEADSTTCSWQISEGDSTFTCLFDFYRDSYAGAEWDHWLPGEGTGSGLLIWHIDESVIRDNLLFNTVNSDAFHKGVDLEEADGIQDMDFIAVDALSFGGPRDAYRAGNADRFGPDTRPNSQGYYGIESGVTIDQISAADTVMTFRVSFGGTHGQWPLVTPGPIGANDVVVAELNGDAALEIAVADRRGNLYVLHDDGTPAWTDGGSDAAFAHLDTPVGTPALADLTGDGIADLLVMADDGRIFGFEGGAFGGGGGTHPGGTPLGQEPGAAVTQPTRCPRHTWARDRTETASPIRLRWRAGQWR
jgi:M6 family metalloprotease-like protein